MMTFEFEATSNAANETDFAPSRFRNAPIKSSLTAI